MRFGIVLLIGLLFILGQSPVCAQAETDTLGLTGTMADTVVGNRLFEEMKGLMKERKWEEAAEKGKQTKAIYVNLWGEECRQVADVWNQLGGAEYYQGIYHKAELSWKKALEIRIKILGAKDPDVARSYNNMGIVLEATGDYDKAIEYKLNALNIRLQIFGPEHPDVAASYNNIGNSFNSKGDYNKAVEYYQNALDIYLKIYGSEHPVISKFYSNMGASFELKGDYDKAIEYFQKALQIDLKISGPEHIDVAKVYNNIGVSFNSKGDYKKAIEYQQKSLDIRLKNLGKEHPDVSSSYSNLGNSFNSIGEYDKAIEYGQEAINIAIKRLGAEHPDIARYYNDIGISFDSKGDYEKAIDYKKKSLNIRLKTLDSEHPLVATSYNNLGISFHYKGNYDKAIECHQKALNIRLKTLDLDHPDIATTFNNLGIAFESKGEYMQAIDYYEKALAIKSKTLGPEHTGLATTYSNIGVSFESKGDHDKAIEYIEKSLNIFLKTLGSEHPDVAQCYNNLGISFESSGDFNQAIEYKNKALNIRLKTLGAQHPDVSQSYNNLGVSYELSGDFSKAIDYYQNAVKACGYTNQNFDNIESIGELLSPLNGLSYTLANKYLQTPTAKLLNESHYFALQALAALDYQQSTFTEVSTKSFWLSQNYPIYEQAISVSLLKADVDKNDTLRHNTFTYAEKSKAALLQAQIKAADALAFAGLPDSLLEQEHKLRIDISWREKQRQGLLDKGLAETDTNVLRIGGIVFDLKQQYEALKKRFETEYPEYYRLKYDLSTVSLQYVQDTLLQKDQALLEYFTGDSSIFLFVVRPDTMIVREVKRDFPLEDWIEGLRYGIYGYYAADKSVQTDALKADAKRNYLEFAPKLYQKLVAPVAQHLPEKVILVPDGPLGYIPFDALLTAAPEDANDFKSYPYLIQQHQFSYTYSATLLREMRDKKHRREPEYDFVAFAPFYNGDTTLLAGMYSYDDLMRKDLQPLAFSGPEVAAASKLMKGETVAGAAATEARFTATAGNYRILHLATHGRADNRVGDYAFLAFTEIQDSLENELLYVKDLYNLQLNADLVVLSACETGIGKLQRGEGIISLARAFAYAGAKSIVTSLWSVNDKSTSELMRFFYRELRRGKDKDEALRLARQRFLKESSVKNSHPFFWAAFVPLGDMRGVK